MKRAVVWGLLAALVAVPVGISIHAADRPAKKADLGKLRHVVLFKFKDGTSKAQVQTIEDAFGGLRSKIPTIVDFEWGTDVSVENLSQGFTHCFLVTFKDSKGRDVYLPHPEHQALVKALKPHLDKVLVIDYVAKK